MIVTGAGGGLGRALVEEFLSSGWRVVAAVRAMAVFAEHELLRVIEMDVSDSAAVNTRTAEILARFGRIDCLVNNAGVTADALAFQLTDEDWSRVIDVNLTGAFRCSRAVARQMARQREGHIINVSSFSGRAGAAGQANYAAAKAGLIGFTQSLARELGPRNVRVNAVLPGVLPTKMTASLAPEQMRAFAEANALGRINSLPEVARFIAFLAATENISGQVFPLDSRIAPWT